jgi:hypothetical protein
VKNLLAGFALVAGALWVSRRRSSGGFAELAGPGQDAVVALKEAAVGLFPTIEPDEVDGPAYDDPNYEALCDLYVPKVEAALDAGRLGMQTMGYDGYVIQSAAVQFWALGDVEGCDSLSDLRDGDLVFFPE